MTDVSDEPKVVTQTHFHVFRWSTQACSCGAPLLANFDETVVEFVQGDAPTSLEWQAYNGFPSSLLPYLLVRGPRAHE